MVFSSEFEAIFFKGPLGMFHSIIKVPIFQYYTMLSSLRSSLWAHHTDATTHSIPHTMLSSLLHIDALFTLRGSTR